MDSVNKTLYIPLYGKSYVSQRGILLRDPMAEAIWEAAGFPLKGKAKSKWLAYSMAMRAAVFDGWIREKREVLPNAVVLHLGCGLDSRAERVGTGEGPWLDVDFPAVIAERKRYYQEHDGYRMLGADIRDRTWLAEVPRGDAIVVMEGVSMYLTPDQLRKVLQNLKEHFDRVCLLMDCYSGFAARASKYKNPINEVGVHQVYGLDHPESVGVLTFQKEWDMNPESLISQLSKGEQGLFRRLYAGKLAKKLYRMYEFHS